MSCLHMIFDPVYFRSTLLKNFLSLLRGQKIIFLAAFLRNLSSIFSFLLVMVDYALRANPPYFLSSLTS